MPFAVLHHFLDEGSTPFTRSIDNQQLTNQCSKRAVNQAPSGLWGNGKRAFQSSPFALNPAAVNRMFAVVALDMHVQTTSHDDPVCKSERRRRNR
jgi:hypothetical protein